METSSSKNHPHKHFSPVSFLAGLLIALAVFFIIYKLVPHTNSPEKNIAVKDSVKVEQQITATEKKEGIDFSEEHFHKNNHHKHISQDAEAMIISPDEMTALEKGTLSDEQKKLLELLPNAPVIYILDFKITDYQNLYFTNGVPVVLENKLSAGQVLHSALKDFSAQQFRNSFQNFQLLADKNPNDVNAQFYAGYCAYWILNYQYALNSFDKVLASENNVFKQEAAWFKAATLYAMQKNEEAKKLLQEIIDRNGFYNAKATQLIKQIK